MSAPIFHENSRRRMPVMGDLPVIAAVCCACRLAAGSQLRN